MSGAFISFEGIEGTGKSTQARLLAESLRAMGVGVVLTAEPGGTPIGDGIRKVLLAVEHAAMDPLTELLLYAAARRQHMAEFIAPALSEGKVVITDRFSDSTLAYQGHGRGLPLELIRALNDAVTGGRKPDLTVLLDIDVKAGLLRNRDAGKVDRLELEDIAFHERVRQGYLEIQRNEPDRVKLVDASGSIEEVRRAVRELVEGLLRRHDIS